MSLVSALSLCVAISLFSTFFSLEDLEELFLGEDTRGPADRAATLDPAVVAPGVQAFDEGRGNASTIHISFLFNFMGVATAAGAMRSILATTRTPVEFHLVCDEFTKEELLVAFGKAGPRLEQLHFYDTQLCKELFNKVGHMMGRKHSKMIICRMMLPDILPTSLDRVLYMDTDVTVLRDLSPIFHTEFTEDQFLGQSIDTYGRLHPSPQWPRAYEVETPAGLVCGMLPHLFSELNKKHQRRCTHKGAFEKAQFNAGMGVYDLGKMRQHNFTGEIVPCIFESRKLARNGKAFEPTQDSMNSYFRKHPKVNKVLPCGANFQFRSEWSGVFCAGKDVYIAHSYHVDDSIYKSPYGRRMAYFWGEKKYSPDAPLTTPIDEEIDYSDLHLVLRYTAECPHQNWTCQNGVNELDGWAMDTSLN